MWRIDRQFPSGVRFRLYRSLCQPVASGRYHRATMPLAAETIPSTLSRAEYEYACVSFCEKQRRRDKDDNLLPIRSGWKWNQHNLRGYGYLSRKRRLLTECEVPDSDGDAPEDEATLDSLGSPAAVVVQEFVVYSATYRVPAFCFLIHDAREHATLLSRRSS
jgi:hypothetical protein